MDINYNDNYVSIHIITILVSTPKDDNYNDNY